ncbi:hypothetical protein BU15DRAFT_70495 [Melanogaster broomeanus]|nr:hypothetical protein BU15DRAFT_70495 [Melanogaster broomeanus]
MALRHMGHLPSKASRSRKRAPSLTSVSDSDPDSGHTPRKRSKAQPPKLLLNNRDDASDERTALAKGSSPASSEYIEHSEPEPRALSPPQGTEHEFAESADFQVIGETDPVEYSDSEDEQGVPVRFLTDFTIYDHKDRLVPIAELLELNLTSRCSYSASGCVKTWIDEEEWQDHDSDTDDEDDDQDLREDRVQRLKLTQIKRFTIHDMKKRVRQLDSNIYVLTQHAWYILGMPSSNYKPFYIGFWLKHRILHLLVTHPESPEDIAISLRMIERSITEEDLQSDDIKSYLLASLDELREDEHINIRRTPVMRTLFGQDVSYEDQEEFKPDSKSGARSYPSQTGTSSTNVELQVLEHRNPTVVTTVVGRVAKLLFEQNIKVAGMPMAEDIEMDEPEPVHGNRAPIVHLANPESVKWGKSADHPGYYQSVLVDGVVYSVGDTVMVEPGVDENKARAKTYCHEPSQSSNSLANTHWFCRIRYLFQDKKGNKMFHGQWLTHSSKTVLQELGHSQALYLMLTDCEDIDIDAISQKCNVRELSPDIPEPVEVNVTEENDFFTGLMFNTTDASLVSLSPEQITRALAHCDSHQQCLSCGLQAMRSSLSHARPLPSGGFAQYEFSYHVHDFVYFKRKQPHSVYKIGQIVKVKGMRVPIEVTVQLFGRYDDVVRRMRERDEKKVLCLDDRRLFKTDEVETVYDEDLQGICYVVHKRDTAAIDEWVKHDDHYYVNQQASSPNVESLNDLENWPKNEYRCCKKCRGERQELLEQQNRLLERHGPLRGLELFSGAGGLGTGFNLSGFVETRWAIEFSPSAARTYQRNHPNSIVYNQCTNLCLQHAIDTLEHKNPKPLLSLDSNKPLPPMPKQGEVDFIYGGPPCQSFSLLNHNKKEFDIRSTLVCNMLSYVEFYRPMYLLLENVFGILVHHQKTSSNQNGIQVAVVKFIQRVLASIGYQCRFAVLQAAQYGAPQGRKRVIFWGARRDVLMPEWPIPTHCSPMWLYRAKLPTGSTLPLIIRNKCEDGLDDDRSAPLHFVTIHEAIGDLPPFDWINPYITIKATSNDKKEDRKRKDILKIPNFSPLEAQKPPYVGFWRPRKHSSQPLSRYQTWMRRHPDGSINEDLRYHYTRQWRANVAERVCAVPLIAGANQFSLPAKLRMELTKKPRAERKYASLYKRLDANYVFATALTTVAPNSKGGAVLHPSQKRILSIQECARAQGFPDYYEFLSVNDAPNKIVADQLRQIGNAVPVPLAYALGKSLGRALLKMWDEKDREGSPEV